MQVTHVILIGFLASAVGGVAADTEATEPAPVVAPAAAPIAPAETNPSAPEPAPAPAIEPTTSVDPATTAKAPPVPSAAPVNEQSIEAQFGFDTGVPADEPVGNVYDDIEQRIAAFEHDEVKRELELAIEDIEFTTHRYHPDLVRPLILLGDAYAQGGEHDQALDHYSRAVHVTRVNTGLFSADQVEIVYREARSHMALGDLEEANNREEYAFEILQNAHDPYDEALIPATEHIANWYLSINSIFDARRFFNWALRIYQANGRTDDLALIPNLQGVAKTYRLERYPTMYASDDDYPSAGFSTVDGSAAYPTLTAKQIELNNFPAGERALQHVIRIYTKDPNTDPMLVADSLLDLADWHLMFGGYQRANVLYEHVYNELLALDLDADGKFAEPRLLYFPQPEDPKPPPATERDAAQMGHVEVTFQVTPQGEIKDLETVSSEPDGMMDFRVRRSMRRAIYRPQLDKGVPVETPAVTFVHEFEYFPRTEPEPPEEQGDVDAEVAAEAESNDQAG